MKKSFKKALSLVAALLFVIPAVLGGCTPEAGADTTAGSTAGSTPGTETGAQTSDTTAAETGEPVDDTVFNYGKVNYVKDVQTTTIPSFDTSKTGQAAAATDDGVIALFDEDFSDGDPNCGNKASSRTEGATGVVDGVLYIPYDANSDTHISGGWTTWAPEVSNSISDYYQMQLSADLRVYTPNANAWCTGFIGCYVSNYTFKIPDGAGDGLWISFNNTSGCVTIYGGNASNWAWPGGNVSVQVDKSLLDGDTHLDVVCTPDYQTSVYLKGTLCCRIVCADGKMTVANGSGEQVYTGDFDMASLSGSHFSVFCHGGGGLAIDDMQIFACSKGEEYKTTTVTATPVGDNKLGCDITNRDDVVSICYSMWFNVILGDGEGKVESALNVTELTEKYGFSARYGFGTKNDQHNAVTAFHYWAKPAQGYYRSTDADAIRNNMTLLYNAGVDFIILDYTYASAPGYAPGTAEWSKYIYNPSTALLNTIMEMRAEGLGTPYVVFWTSDESLYDALWDNFYGMEKWQDCFVYWNDKPFVMEWNYSKSETDKYTIRGMYGLRQSASAGQWSYLEIDNTSTVSYIKDNNPEQVCVCVATQETYMSLSSAHGRDGGKFWNTQWKTAFSVRPKIVTVTWWNEWCAQLYQVDGVGFVFTDNFNEEYSRDIEPMEGGHGDQYYQWLCTYIKEYRAGNDCPSLIEN